MWRFLLISSVFFFLLSGHLFITTKPQGNYSYNVYLIDEAIKTQNVNLSKSTLRLNNRGLLVEEPSNFIQPVFPIRILKEMLSHPGPCFSKSSQGTDWGSLHEQ